jgi:hypothetical protein
MVVSVEAGFLIDAILHVDGAVHIFQDRGNIVVCLYGYAVSDQETIRLVVYQPKHVCAVEGDVRSNGIRGLANGMGLLSRRRINAFGGHIEVRQTNPGMRASNLHTTQTFFHSAQVGRSFSITFSFFSVCLCRNSTNGDDDDDDVDESGRTTEEKPRRLLW